MKKTVKKTWAAAILCARSWIIGAEPAGGPSVRNPF